MRPSKEYIGGVPVVVHLADEDALHPTDRPAPAAFVLPRTTLLLAIVRDLLQLFRPYAAALHPETTQVWFSFREVPLSWMYPAGAVKDYVNECLREERTAHLMSSPSTTPATSSPPPNAAELLHCHLCSIPSEPLELTFHIHSLTKGSSLARTVPLYISFDRLEEYIRMEVKQAHKAAYTVLYGDYTIYQREADTALQAAVGLALYRPFDVAAQEQQQRQAAIDASGAAGGSRSSGGGNLASIMFTSPYLLTEYQQLLRGVLSSRPHVAYLIRVSFPFAYRGAAGRGDGGFLQYDFHRVSAAPALAWPADSTEVAAAAAVKSVVPAERLTFGLLLWRLFRVPVLRWQHQQQRQPPPQSSADAAVAVNSSSGETLTEAGRAYQRLLSSLAPFYADPPACAPDRLEEQEPLLMNGSLEPPAWASWEQTMSHAFFKAYEHARESNGDDPRGLPFWDDVTPSACGSPSRRMRFVVQGIYPPLATPASFLETNMSSSDRAIFTLVEVSRG